MFGLNRVAHPRDYVGYEYESLQVTSIFHTLQGEGPFTGQPAYFVRLTGCNLRCSFCDTYFDQGDVLSFKEILTRIENSTLSGCVTPKLVVITGGEPTIQPGLGAFVLKLLLYGYRVQIESNGNFPIKIASYSDVHIVLSPKVNESTGNYIKLHASALERACALKFVIAPDAAGYENLPGWALAWRKADPIRRSLYVSPMNRYLVPPAKLDASGTLERRSDADERVSFWTPGLLDQEANQRNHEHAAAIALEHGAFLSLQTHLYANLP